MPRGRGCEGGAEGAFAGFIQAFAVASPHLRAVATAMSPQSIFTHCRRVRLDPATLVCIPWLQVLLALLLRDYTITLTEGTSDKSWVPSMLDGMKRKDGGKMLLEFKKDAPGADGALNAAAA